MRSTVRKEYQKRRKKQWIVVLVSIPVILLFLLQVIDQHTVFIGTVPLAIITVVFLGSVVAFTCVNWRCPSCNAFLGKNISAERCEQCGARLQGGSHDPKRKQ
jgi:hypothetical protein